MCTRGENVEMASNVDTREERYIAISDTDNSISADRLTVSVIVKILEKLVAGQLSAHLQPNNVLHPHQGAYQHSKSTSDILLVAVDSITSFLDNGDLVCCIFLDLCKAFDSLDHSICWRDYLTLTCPVLY